MSDNTKTAFEMGYDFFEPSQLQDYTTTEKELWKQWIASGEAEEDCKADARRYAEDEGLTLDKEIKDFVQGYWEAACRWVYEL